MIGVKGSIFENDRPFTLGGGGGTWGAGEGPIWDYYVTPARDRFLPHRSHHLGYGILLQV
jgi:hypothetical protein